MRKKLKQQESIPVGCVPPTSVATTRYQHCTFCTLQAVTFWGVPFGCVPSKGCTFQRVCLLRGYLVGLYLLEVHLLRKYLLGECPGGVPALVHPTHKEHPLEGTLTRYTPTTPSNIHTPRRYLGPGIPTPSRDLGSGIPISPVYRITDTRENITFPQLHWWVVIT